MCVNVEFVQEVREKKKDNVTETEEIQKRDAH